jgi:chromosomal replication initiation ATPase DnaA
MNLKMQLHLERKARLQRLQRAAIRNEVAQAGGADVLQFKPQEQEVKKTKEVRFRDWLFVHDRLDALSFEATNISRIKKIIFDVCEQTEINWVDLKSERRMKPLLLPRQYLMWRLRNETTLSLPLIGKHIGNRDHTTVLHGVRKYQALVDEGKAPFLPTTNYSIDPYIGE